MRAGLSKLLIIALVLASSLISFSAISLADDPPGMWHPADEIGPGTFKPGDYNWIVPSKIKGNATIELQRSVTVQDKQYFHSLTFPQASLSYGYNIYYDGLRVFANDSVALNVISWSTSGSPAAQFYGSRKAASFESFGNPTVNVYNYIDGTGIQVRGGINITGDIIPKQVLDHNDPLYGVQFNLGSSSNSWNSTYTRWLCLGTPPICKNAWTGGGSGTAPGLQDVTTVSALTRDEITTGGLKLKTGAVISSESGNVIIKLGSTSK